MVKLKSTFANLPETAFNEKALEKPAVDHSEEEMYVTQLRKLITNLDVPETAFNEEPLEKPAVSDSEEDRFRTQKALQNERLVITLHYQP